MTGRSGVQGSPESDPWAAYALDKKALRRAFDRASGTYDEAAVLQREVRATLLERLDLTRLTPRAVLDAGAGTGHASRELKRRYPRACVIALDSSRAMLGAAGRQQSWVRRFARVCGDAEALPLADGSVDLILSNFLLPWTRPDVVFEEFRRVLAPRGLLTFSTLGPDTLQELRAAWAAADSHPRADAPADPPSDRPSDPRAGGDRSLAPALQPHTHVNQFIDMHDLGDALVRAGFAAPVLDVERFTLTYLDVGRLAHDLKAVGAHNVTAGRPKGLTGRVTFAAMQAAYEPFRRDGRLPATYEVVFGQAWAPTAAAPRSDRADTAISLQEIKRQLRDRR